ncbi:MAG: hypothetical protein RhofKO_31250 [Rhodothermales bacterium]
MKKNIGTIDRVIRVLLAATIVLLYFANVISGTLALVLGIVALVFVATSFVGTCPAYLPFGLSTRRSVS